MLVLSQPILENVSGTKTCKHSTSNIYGIPVIDLSQPDAKTLIVKACQEFGFFKVINHGVSIDYMTKLEAEAIKFFNLSLSEKDRFVPPNLFGYGNKKIGPSGDVGWIEYLLFNITPEIISRTDTTIFSENLEYFWSIMNDYVSSVKNMACMVLEMIADELQIGPHDVLSKLLSDEKSDSYFRVNHYPPYPELQTLSGRNLIGFGEHTDPQIISVLRSNNISGLQISVKDGTWISVPPDQYSLFINVGDSLQVLTNGRFNSVKHRVLTGSSKSRISMIYFGGPPLSEKIAPLSSLMEEGEESLYKDFTWCEYKKSFNKTKLGDDRLSMFEKKIHRVE